MTPALGRVAAIVPAAGRGERLGPGAPKALRDLGGVPMLVHAVRAMADARSVALVIVAAPPADVEAVQALLGHGMNADVTVIAGGDTRQQSVQRALAVLPVDVDVVLVHDAARPLAPSELADAVVAAVRRGAEAVVPALPVADTVKVVDGGERVTSTLDRSTLRAVQTPQGFTRRTLAAAHAAVDGGHEATDDAGLVERLGRDVLVVPGSDEAFKVTRPIDLVFAESVLDRRRAGHVV